MATFKERATIREKIANFIKKGETVKTVATRFGVGCEHVRKACKEFAVSLPPNSNYKEFAARSVEMAYCVKQGETPLEVATRFGVTRATVYRACKIQGMHLGIRQMKPSTYAVIATLQNTTHTPHDIAKQYNLDTERINRILRECLKAGIQIPHRKKQENPT
jgi:DNA invertase Pin-like site-specific DNA recombinase